MSNAANVAKLETALAKGVLTVEIDGSRVTYQSIPDLLAAIDYFKAQDAQAGTAGAQYATTLAVFGNG